MTFIGTKHFNKSSTCPLGEERRYFIKTVLNSIKCWQRSCNYVGEQAAATKLCSVNQKSKNISNKKHRPTSGMVPNLYLSQTTSLSYITLTYIGLCYCQNKFFEPSTSTTDVTFYSGVTRHSTYRIFSYEEMQILRKVKLANIPIS